MQGIANKIAMNAQDSLDARAQIYRLADADWARVAKFLRGCAGARARNNQAGRKFVEAVLWVAKAGVGWTLLPAHYGQSHAVYMRFTRWVKQGMWTDVVKALDGDDVSTQLANLIDEYECRVGDRKNLKSLKKILQKEAEVRSANIARRVFHNAGSNTIY